MPSHAHDHWSLGSAESRDKSIWQRNRWKIPSLVPEQRGGTGVPEEKPCRIGTRQCPATRPREDQEGTPPTSPALLKVLLASAPIRPWPCSEAGRCCRAGPGLPSGTRCACVRADTDTFAEKVWLKICCETKVHPWEQFGYDANKQCSSPWRNTSWARWPPLQPSQ